MRDRSVPPGTSKALLSQAEDYDLSYEVNAREFLNDFEHKGFRFEDVWEFDFSDYDWWFLWALHAIVWGIAKYDSRDTTAASPAMVTVDLPKAVA